MTTFLTTYTHTHTLRNMESHGLSFLEGEILYWIVRGRVLALGGKDLTDMLTLLTKRSSTA